MRITLVPGRWFARRAVSCRRLPDYQPVAGRRVKWTADFHQKSGLIVHHHLAHPLGGIYRQHIPTFMHQMSQHP